jgi:sec-independent protein translocase protein TatB
MFGMGFTEILLIAVIAILFLGPDKLPSTMVEIAKFFKSVKGTINSVKSSLEEEMEATGIKQEALAYKEELLKTKAELAKVSDVKSSLNDEINSILNDEPQQKEDNNTAAVQPKATEPKKAPIEPQEVTFKKKKKKKREEVDNV